MGRGEEEVREGRVPKALHLRPCMEEEFLKLQQEVEDKYDLIKGILASGLGTGGDNAPTNIADRTVQIVSHVWIEGRRIVSLQKATVEVGGIDEVTKRPEKKKEPKRRSSGKSGQKPLSGQRKEGYRKKGEKCENRIGF